MGAERAVLPLRAEFKLHLRARAKLYVLKVKNALVVCTLRHGFMNIDQYMDRSQFSYQTGGGVNVVRAYVPRNGY